ncbi:unnamed protein product [Urochloa humidicola]
MATPWVLLYRIVRAEHAAAAGPALEPGFTLPAAAPPGVAVLAAGRGAHPDPNRPDEQPFIIAAAPLCLLARFSVAPSIGQSYADNPRDIRLVVARDFLRAAGGQITASADLVPDRDDPVPNISNILSVGLVSYDFGGYTIAELQVHRGAANATLVTFDSGDDAWFQEEVESPLPEAERGREWVPHGSVVLETTLWWFDLSWGIVSSDINGDLELLFHRLPLGRELPAANQFMLGFRCITMCQGDLRYVEIIRDAGAGADDDDSDGDIEEGEGAAVHMWTMSFGEFGWEWQANYAVRFEEIWNHESYADTELLRMVPVLVAVSPLDPNVVYFALNRRIFGVNVPERRAVAYEGPCNVVVNNATMVVHDAGRLVLPWGLPPTVAPGAAGKSKTRLHSISAKATMLALLLFSFICIALITQIADSAGVP